MNNFLRTRRVRWITGVTLVMVMLLGLYSFNDDKRNFEVIKNLDIFYTLFREVNSYYVDETNPEELITEGINNMLESLDPYTTYIPESDMEDFRFMTTGEYAGIGSLISKKGEYVVIAEPYEGFPAAKAGLKTGDKILEIDGKSMVGKNTPDVSEMLKGPAKTTLKIKVERPGEKKPINIELERQKIQINPVPYYGMVNDETGIIQLNNFTQDCAREVEKAFLDLRDKQGAKSVVLDLRANPGGLLDEAVKIVNLFVPSGSEVVSTRGKVKQWDKTYNAMREPIDTVMPLAVLISRGSASASEIVSGALQDLDRAVVLGQRSFGKGLVQTTRNLSYNAKLKVTTAKYYIPSGRCIQALDYTHRDEDGAVGLVADSLISEYKTKNGRSVFDGGGISPDIKVESHKYANVTFALVVQQMIFDYATEFVLRNKSIDAPEAFAISDDEYNRFIEFVKAKEDFKYESLSQEKFKELVKTAKREGYYEKAEEDFTAMEALLKLDVEKDMRQFEDEIRELMVLEITKRYYYQKGAIKAGLQNDAELEEAKKLLKDMNQYKGLLDGTVASHAGDRRATAKKS
ncbi:PDZ domain-containing protein [Carboxylicivirga sediminis]|uniref:PDZ domain-containing protein n=1 Tax=Carboxylicivirga sediminis TaxID=2006564 RepID=A0A941F5F5_9BACT|nr:S41 family peptidase [Carboxylicivirga sediminis]MBR8536797.1 PDZ domain-containing protein [Carboxylicivirga sediminis]